MKVNAYILAADPSWIEASVLSYYPMVDRIVVSFDAEGRGWTGASLDVENCLTRVRAIDKDGKFDFRPGHFARPQYFDRPMLSETHQRQVALEQASDGADWILQLDTDEILGDIDVFLGSLAAADAAGADAMNYPSVWLYCRAFGRWYLESGQRGWRRNAGFPGPMAVRAGSTFTHARRVNGSYFHVDLTARPSAVAVPRGIPVSKVIPSSAAIWHLSMVRSEAFMRRKLSTTGHAHDRDWNPEIRRWMRARAHPIASALFTQLERGNYKRPLRLTSIPPHVDLLLQNSSCDTVDALRN